MVRLSFGLIAVILWLALIVLLGFALRASPGPPHRSVRKFRRARRSIAPPPEARFVARSPAPVETVAERSTLLSARVSAGSSERAIAPTAEVSSGGPRTRGGVRYFTVDEQGRPEL
ncbi:MAG: hypothetical protein ACRDI1_02420 [Actinomycetota bacterium]